MGQRRTDCAGMPLWQLRFGAHPTPMLLACRSPYAAAVYSVTPDPTPSQTLDPSPSRAGSLSVSDQEGMPTGTGPGRESHAGSAEPYAGSAGPGWALAPVAALRTKRRLAHLAWNRMLHSHLALTCEDGSLHVADVAAPAGGAIGLGFQQTRFPAALLAERVGGAPMEAAGSSGTPRGRAVCEWAPHPRVLLSTHGAANDSCQVHS